MEGKGGREATKGLTVKTYWWRAHPNFGDMLNPLLLHHFCDFEPEWAPPAEAELVMTGSTLDVLPAGWSGIIAGTGKLRASTSVPADAIVLGVRGKLTARGVPGSFCLGDPGLLVDELIPPQEKIYNLVVLPHWTDTEGALAKRFAHLDPFVINPAWDPLRVVAEIARSKKVVSSSLHGIIVADAFGIPRRAEKFPKMGSHQEGGTFKFEDYSSVVGLPMQFGKLGAPPRLQVEAIQAELFEMMRALARMTHA